MPLPSYRSRLSPGELSRRAAALHRLLEACAVCPHACGARRLDGERGSCRTGRRALVASAGPHFGEEAPLVGSRGSGTIFFAGCNLGCQFCQNYDISHLGEGREVSAAELAGIMLRLQQGGCHNINLVSPTHVTPQIVEALALAAAGGLALPLVYNCGGYESAATLRLLDGVVDIYMPDIKYGSDAVALRYSGARGYWESVRQAVREMHRQVGVLQIGPDGLAGRGLLIRHLVLPNGAASSAEVLRFVAEEISRDSYINIMDQYRPMFHADRFPELGRPITAGEHLAVLREAGRRGLRRGFPQAR